MKPAYNEVVRRVFFYGTQTVQSVLSGRPGDDAPYYTHAVVDPVSGAVHYVGRCQEDCERRIRAIVSHLNDTTANDLAVKEALQGGMETYLHRQGEVCSPRKIERWMSVERCDRSVQCSEQEKQEVATWQIKPLTYREEMIPWVFRNAGDTTLPADWNPHMVYFYFMENGVKYFSYARVDAKSARDAYRRCKEWCFKLTGSRALDPSIRIKMTREEYEQYESTGRIRLLTGRGDA